MSNKNNKRTLEEEPVINNDVKVTKKSKKNQIASLEPLPEEEDPLPEPLPEPIPEPERDSSSDEEDDQLDLDGMEDEEESSHEKIEETKDKNKFLSKPIPKREMEKEENSYVLNPDHIDMLKKIDYNSVLRFRHKIESVSIRRRLEMFNYIRSDMRPVITDLLQINYSHVKEESDWIDWSDE